MKFELLKFESVTSTNDMAINLIKGNKKKLGASTLLFRRMVEEHMVKNGYQKKEICLFPYFFL